jgi:hypothetical protein
MISKKEGNKIIVELSIHEVIEIGKALNSTETFGKEDTKFVSDWFKLLNDEEWEE